MPFVQGTTDLTQDTATAYATAAATFGANVTAGNCIVFVIGYGGTASDGATITDTLLNTYTLIQTAVDTVNSQLTEVYVAYNVAGGANTVTATFVTARQYNRVLIAEYSGIQTTTPVDQSNSVGSTGSAYNPAGTTTDAIPSGSVTTTSASETILSIYQDTSEAPGTGGLTAGTGFTLDVQDGTAGTIAIESQTVGAIGTYSPTWTRTTGQYIANITLSLKNAVTAMPFTGSAVGGQKLPSGHETGAAQDPSGITANDTWTNPVSIELVQDVSVGTLSLQINGLFTYTPPPTFVGIVTFQYRLWELGVPSNTGTVTIEVDGSFAGQAVSGSLLRSKMITQGGLGYSRSAIGPLFIGPAYASGFTGSQSLPFIGASTASRTLRQGRLADKKTGQSGQAIATLPVAILQLSQSTAGYAYPFAGIASSILLEQSLVSGGFVQTIGYPFVVSAQAIVRNDYQMPATKIMGWNKNAVASYRKVQVQPASAPFMTAYPIIINANFALTSWSANMSFE